MISENIDLEYWNNELRYKSPEEIIAWALTLTENRVVTTSFGIYSAVLLYTFFNNDKDIRVIWCDTGYNTPDTYRHSANLIDKFELNIQKYSPLQTSAYTDATLGIPDIDDPKHEEFTEIVKLEPFKRAFKELNPELWFTNIRIRQTELRKSKDILSVNKNGVLKVSPFYYWTDKQLDDFIIEHNLPKNRSYYDPTKVLNNRECGIHVQ
jgi:phosphoadenosine phosphosulfate reductase